jgi:2'-5' RNA ligase
MSDQLSFLDTASPRPATDGVFIALFPAAAGDRMRRVAEQQREQHTLMGRLQAAERLHLSLIDLGEHAGLPQRTVEIARAAGDAMSGAPFELTFDRVESFAGKPGACPRVLLCRESAELKGLHQALALALKQAGHPGKVPLLGTPHITLMYADRRAPAEAVDPIHWTVDELVLVHSLIGKSTYKPLGRWPLRG